MLRPGRPRANEDVRAARVRVIARCSNHGVVPGDGHPGAKTVTCGRIQSGEFLLLRPGRPRANEDVRAATSTPSIIIAMCTNHGVVPGDGHAGAEIVTCSHIRGGEFLLLRPGRPRSNEDVCAARVRVIAPCSDHGVVPGDGHTAAENVTSSRVRSGELLLLRPHRTRGRRRSWRRWTRRRWRR